jgi:FkbM family methyltransferase
MKYTTFLKRAFIIFKTPWLKSVFKGQLISFSSYEILNNIKKQCKELNTIIDVGANKGQFQKSANYFYPNAKIYSFEPIHELYNKLVKNNYTRITNFNMALGNEVGIQEFNKNEYRHSSSFYEIEIDNNNFPSSKTTKINVEINTLDNIAPKLDLIGTVLLKLDVQGFEMEALRGGKNTLKNHIDYIIIEISFKKLYNNQPTYTELNKFLNEQNFELVTLLDFNLGKDKSYIEADFLYIKKT